MQDTHEHVLHVSDKFVHQRLVPLKFEFRLKAKIDSVVRRLSEFDTKLFF